MKEWIARIAFSAVFAINVICALQFIFDPMAYIGAYQLTGTGAQAAIQGYGIVFLMWNATYPLFIWKPSSHRMLGIIILAQQLIGCIGETIILLSLPSAGAELLHSSILRFIAFDAGGFVVMLIGYIVLFSRRGNAG